MKKPSLPRVIPLLVFLFFSCAHSLDITSNLNWCGTSPCIQHRTDTFCPNTPIQYGDQIQLTLDGYDNSTDPSEVYATINGHDFRSCAYTSFSSYHVQNPVYRLVCSSTEETAWSLAGLEFTVHLTAGSETASPYTHQIFSIVTKTIGLNDGRLIVVGSCLISPIYQTVDVWGNGCPDAVAPEGTTNIIVCQFTPAQLEYWGYNFTVQTPPTTSTTVDGFVIDPSFNPISQSGQYIPEAYYSVSTDISIDISFPSDTVIDDDDNIFYSPTTPPTSAPTPAPTSAPTSTPTSAPTSEPTPPPTSPPADPTPAAIEPSNPGDSSPTISPTGLDPKTESTSFASTLLPLSPIASFFVLAIWNFF